MASLIIVCQSYVYGLIRELVDINGSLEAMTLGPHMAAYRIQKAPPMSGFIGAKVSLFKLRARRIFFGFVCDLIRGPVWSPKRLHVVTHQIHYPIHIGGSVCRRRVSSECCPALVLCRSGPHEGLIPLSLGDSRANH